MIIQTPIIIFYATIYLNRSVYIINRLSQHLAQNLAQSKHMFIQNLAQSKHMFIQILGWDRS